MKIQKKIIIGIVLFGLLGMMMSCLKSQSLKQTITVFGRSKIYTAPDNVLINFVVDSKNKDLSEAKILNDKKISKINKLFEKYNVKHKDVNIENITISPQYSYNNHEEQRFLYYKISQNISVKIVDINQYEPFLTELLKSGVDKISNINFLVSNIRKFKDDARISAIKAAEEKASTMVSAVSNNGKTLKLGEVIRISELLRDSYYNQMSQNVISDFSVDSLAGSFSPAGQVQINAEVEVVFKLR